MAGLTSGVLVEVSGLPEQALEGPRDAKLNAVSLNGQRAQLIRYDKPAQKWIAVTFSGVTLALESGFLRPLRVDELGQYDFVFGPKSDLNTLAVELSNVLEEKGYAAIRLFVTEEDAAGMLAAAQTLESDDHFSRIATEFERGYLGIDGYAKALLINPSSAEVPDCIRKSALVTMDKNFTALSELLEPYTLDTFGFKIFSRSNMLMQMPMVSGDDEKYPNALVEDGHAEGYMQTMVRAKLTLMQFVGPTPGVLSLVPRAEGQKTVSLTAEPGMMLVLATGRYEYSLELSGEALTLSAFLLSEPPNFNFMTAPEGDMQVLGVLGSGPPPPPSEQCVIDGMYCRYGTGACGRDQFWMGVGRASTDGLTDVPIVRFDMSPYYDPENWTGWKSYTKHGCFGIEGVELFDNKFFEISPAEAKGMDPAQRQVMEVSYMALLEGGWDKRSLQRQSQNIGHFAGIDKDDWLCMTSAGMIDLSGTCGAAAAANAITSNRFAYSLNLKGASMTIDTACSSSLVCTHVSKLHLRFKIGEEMPASIVNGLNIMLYQGPFVGCSQAGMLSHEGRSFSFNSTADGYARGELSGAIIFKIQDYESNKDTVLACLAGSQANQDGRSASLSAPNGPAQEKCMNAVLKECSLTPTEVDCIECHGTGTSLGDPIEVGAFRKVMSYTPRFEPMVITSSKSNIAHGEGGAGLAGFFKCCMQVMHCEGASNVHLRIMNPHLDMAGFPCQMLSEGVAMREDSAYSGVSSFGFGGTNAHAEAWGSNIMTSRGGAKQDPQLIFQKKLARAPPADITIVGDNVWEWETSGPDPRAEPGTSWRVELDEDGTITWEVADDDTKEYGYEFFIRGSHTDWNPFSLDRHEEIQGLWTGAVELGKSGEEEFQVMGDGNADMIYHPGMKRCSSKAAPVKGPEKAEREEFTWLVTGEPGSVFRIEFFQQDSYISILWLQQPMEE